MSFFFLYFQLAKFTGTIMRRIIGLEKRGLTAEIIVKYGSTP